MYPGRFSSIVVSALALLISAPAAAQETGHGDVLGDLVHILRDPTTGQPILQRKQIEYPGDVVAWGYCPIPVDDVGLEIPLLTLSCEVDPAHAARLVEVDYFGRLSGGRTKERNLRMHFDETITGIIEAEAVELEPGGRLRLGTSCTPDGACLAWRVIDSPMENHALYHRLMKYGHIQTDPAEEDTSFHGDPAIGTVYHPALRASDWGKFRGALASLLPRAAVSDCFDAVGTFDAACAQPQALTREDFTRAASFLAGAADKTGKMTVDLIQYMNRIIKITQTTPESAATLNTLPALIRDVDADGMATITPAPPGLASPADERFVDFSSVEYFRDAHFDRTLPAVVKVGDGLWSAHPAVPLLPFLQFINGPAAYRQNIDGFVANAGDALRSIEFIHEYEIPSDLSPLPPPPPVAVTIPGVIGMSEAQALETILALGLTAGVVTRTYDASVPAGVVISQAPPAGTVVEPGTAVAFTVSLGPPSVAVPAVVGLTEAEARAAILAAGLTIGSFAAEYSPTAPGTIVIQVPAGGTTVLIGSAVSCVVSLGPEPSSPIVASMVHADGYGVQRTPAFVTEPGQILVAFAASDGPSAVNAQELTISGAGVSWTRVGRAAKRYGVAEIWVATAPSVLSNVTVTSRQATGPYYQSLTVAIFNDASGVGASAIGGATGGAPTASIVTQRPGSIVFAIGHDWDRAVPRSMPAGQTKLHEYLAPYGDTFWLQRLDAPVPAAGTTVTLGVLGPTNDQWNFAVVEIIR